MNNKMSFLIVSVLITIVIYSISLLDYYNEVKSNPLFGVMFIVCLPALGYLLNDFLTQDKPKKPKKGVIKDAY